MTEMAIGRADHEKNIILAGSYTTTTCTIEQSIIQPLAGNDK